MNSTMYWVIGVIVLIILGFLAWFYSQPSTPQPAVVTQSGTESPSESGSIASLVSKGGTWECSVAHGSGSEATQGTVYVSGKNVRGDFESEIPQAGKVESHMISDGEYVYVWSSMMQSGMKMKVDAASQTNNQTQSSQNFYAQNYDYHCNPWTSDQAKFSLPAGITFSDMSALIPSGAKANGSIEGSTGANCAMCDQAPNASAKAQCRAAMGCK